MKILIFSDVHWSTNSSLIRTRGDEFSVRLEHLIAGMDWVNELALAQGCDCMVCAGDFMDKSQLTDEEITALQQIKWNDLRCYFLCGNHESSVSDLRYSSLKAIESERHLVVDSLRVLHVPGCDILFLPYMTESDRLPLASYLDKAGLIGQKNNRLVIFSHNDIAGINYGGFESKSGFSISEIEDGCDLYLNGHLHNSEWITDRILNLGSFTAHNFTNDSARYRYGVWTLDTDTLKLTFFDNPYGFNFYKVEITAKRDFEKLDGLKPNAVASIKCVERLLPSLKEKLASLSTPLLESRITAVKPTISDGTVSIADLQSDHLEKFVTFCKANISNSAILDAELAEVCK